MQLQRVAVAACILAGVFASDAGSDGARVSVLQSTRDAGSGDVSPIGSGITERHTGGSPSRGATLSRVTSPT